ncbi:MAG: fumarylacetoacetate hydrolase family protein [Xanthobacteraceae bacterium]
MAFDIQGAARALARDHRENRRFEAIAGLPDLAAAYRVQDAYVAGMAGDDPVVGYKIGLTSQQMQSMCGISHPIAGVVLGSRVMHSGARLRFSDYGRLGLEFEICARLGRDLPPRPTPYTRAEIAAAIDGVCAAMELVDDRNADYATLDVASLVADNSWNAGIVLGEFVTPPADLAQVTAIACLDGVEIGRGVGADALGHPYETLVWLSGHLGADGRGLKAGDLVMTGSLVRTCFPDKAFAYRFDVAGVSGVEVSGG